MPLLKAVLIDDEKHCLDTLSDDLRNYCPEVEVVAQFEASAPALSWLRQHQTDVVFLDIVLPDMSGFQLLEQLAPLPFHVIFTTAYIDYAVQALRISAVDFLQKPVDRDELTAAVMRLKQKKESSISADHFRTLLENLERPGKPKRIGLPTRLGIDFLPVSDILYFEADGNYAQAFIHGKEKPLFVTRPLKELELTLSGFPFCRIHHTYLAHLDHVERYLRGDGGQVVMSNGTKLPVSRGRKEDFLGGWGR